MTWLAVVLLGLGGFLVGGVVSLWNTSRARGTGVRGAGRGGDHRGGVVADRLKRVVVLDYGSGNIASAHRALLRTGADVEVTADFDAALNADGLVVPGVGAFAAVMAGLHAVRGERIIDRRLAGSRPVLGICVGMQVMFERGIEHGVQTEGVGEWPGVVERLQATRGAAHGVEHRRSGAG